jgi:hypothetical protein
VDGCGSCPCWPNLASSFPRRRKSSTFTRWSREILDVHEMVKR